MKGHKERLLNHLVEHGSITTKEAIDKLGNTRLSEYIRQLRADGYTIQNEPQTGKNRFGETTHFDRFVLVDGISQELDSIVNENENHISL